jgi:hypothetical protein
MQVLCIENLGLRLALRLGSRVEIRLRLQMSLAPGAVSYIDSCECRTARNTRNTLKLSVVLSSYKRVNDVAWRISALVILYLRI